MSSTDLPALCWYTDWCNSWNGVRTTGVGERGVGREREKEKAFKVFDRDFQNTFKIYSSSFLEVFRIFPQGVQESCYKISRFFFEKIATCVCANNHMPDSDPDPDHDHDPKAEVAIEFSQTD